MVSMFLCNKKRVFPWMIVFVHLDRALFIRAEGIFGYIEVSKNYV